MHLNNAFALRKEINKVFCHHEQACSMAATGYARAVCKPAVVSVTSGPGGINTLNGVEGAWADSVPMVVIAGHPRYSTTVESTGLNLRCRGVQEFNIIPAVRGMTKYAKLVTDPLSIAREVQYCIDLAMEGRRGPTWLSIPLDVQSTRVDTDDLYQAIELTLPEYDTPSLILPELNRMLQESERPCILTGSGIRTSGTTELFKKFSQFLGMPIVGGALLPDILHQDFPEYYGGSGSVGPRIGNYILQNADLILVLGNSLNTKQTGFNQQAFVPNAKIIMIDAQKDEAFKPGLNITLPIHMDLKSFFEEYESYILKPDTNSDWIKFCETAKELLADTDKVRLDESVSPVKQAQFWECFLERLPPHSAVVLGNSSCIIGMLQRSIKRSTQRVFVNYNSGSMGDDLPQAVGVAVGLKSDVFCVTGDGSIMMNLQELQTIMHYKLPVKIIIFSNDGYNAIRQTHKNYFNGLYTGCDPDSGVSFPDFGKIAASFGYNYRRCSCVGELSDSISWLLNSQHCLILEIKQILDDPVFPKVVSRMLEDGTFETPGLTEMYPYLEDALIKKLMPEW